MKLWAFFLLVFGAVGLCYGTPVLLAWAVTRLGYGWPANAAIVLLAMAALVLLLFVVAFREERKAREAAR